MTRYLRVMRDEYNPVSLPASFLPVYGLDEILRSDFSAKSLRPNLKSFSNPSLACGAYRSAKFINLAEDGQKYPREKKQRLFLNLQERIQFFLADLCRLIFRGFPAGSRCFPGRFQSLRKAFDVLLKEAFLGGGIRRVHKAQGLFYTYRYLLFHFNYFLNKNTISVKGCQDFVAVMDMKILAAGRKNNTTKEISGQSGVSGNSQKSLSLLQVPRKISQLLQWTSFYLSSGSLLGHTNIPNTNNAKPPRIIDILIAKVKLIKDSLITIADSNNTHILPRTSAINSLRESFSNFIIEFSSLANNVAHRLIFVKKEYTRRWRSRNERLKAVMDMKNLTAGQKNNTVREINGQSGDAGDNLEILSDLQEAQKISQSLSGLPFYFSGQVLCFVYVSQSKLSPANLQESLLLLLSFPLFVTPFFWIYKYTYKNKQSAQNTDDYSQRKYKLSEKITCESNHKNTFSNICYSFGDELYLMIYRIFHQIKYIIDFNFCQAKSANWLLRFCLIPRKLLRNLRWYNFEQHNVRNVPLG